MRTRDAPPLGPVPADLRELWDDALRDAGFTHADVELQLFDGDPTAPKPQWGMHLAPEDTTHDLDDHFTDAQRDAVDKLNLYKHRVVVWLGAPRLPGKIIQALMRHELRHAEQVDHNNWVYRIGIMTAVSLGRVYAGKGDGSASVRRLIPHEADANAAATQLVAPVGDAAGARDGNFRPLVTETQPLRRLDTLGRRTLAFAALHPEAFVAEARARAPSERLVLEELDPDAPALFAKLVADEKLTALRDGVAAAIPSADAIAAAGAEPAAAWQPLRERLAVALARAEELLEAYAAEEMPQIWSGQRWRMPNGDELTVESVDDQNVHVFIHHAGAAGATSTTAFAPRELGTFTRLHEFRVAVEVGHLDDTMRRLSGVGRIDHVQTPAPSRPDREGFGPARYDLIVRAADADEARDRVAAALRGAPAFDEASLTIAQTDS
jgi:hypothetical protein